MLIVKDIEETNLRRLENTQYAYMYIENHSTFCNRKENQQELTACRSLSARS